MPGISLANLFDQYAVRQCSLLKCNVEGAEFEIFENAPAELLARVDRIVMEVHLTTRDWNPQRFHALCRRLAAAGFRIEHGPLVGPRGEANRCFALTACRYGQGSAQK